MAIILQLIDFERIFKKPRLDSKSVLCSKRRRTLRSGNPPSLSASMSGSSESEVYSDASKSETSKSSSSASEESSESLYDPDSRSDSVFKPSPASNSARETMRIDRFDDEVPLPEKSEEIPDGEHSQSIVGDSTAWSQLKSSSSLVEESDRTDQWKPFF